MARKGGEMRNQLLLPSVSADPPTLKGIDLRNCAVEDLLPISGDLAIADPPWLNRERHGASNAHDHYAGLPVEEIIEHLRQIDANRLVLWITWPVLTADWPKALPKWGKPVTGGAWYKSGGGGASRDSEGFPTGGLSADTGHYGQGFHWAGCSEAVLIYTRGTSYNNKKSPLRNAWFEQRGLHSRKPVMWQAQMISRWCPMGGVVVDPYAGLGSVPEAVLELDRSRQYIGSEKSTQRYHEAMSLLAQWRKD
jgi:hypothetical protein